MHWFWRGLIAFVAGWGVNILMLVPTIVVVGTLSMQAAVPMIRIISIVRLSLTLVATIAVYGMLTRRSDARRIFERETCCRRCGYVLRGISEPRCPECGERI